MKPSICRMVIARVDPVTNNGSSEAPAVITHVWSDTLVNIRVLADSNATPWLTSVTLHDTEPAPEAKHVAWWPPRA